MQLYGLWKQNALGNIIPPEERKARKATQSLCPVHDNLNERTLSTTNLTVIIAN